LTPFDGAQDTQGARPRKAGSMKTRIFLFLPPNLAPEEQHGRRP